MEPRRRRGQLRLPLVANNDSPEDDYSDRPKTVDPPLQRARKHPLSCSCLQEPGDC